MNHITETIRPREASEQGERAIFIDVRTPAEFSEIHIDGAILYPLNEIKPELVRERIQGKIGVIVCRSGGRAKQAYQKLVANGVENLSVLEGGMNAWESAGLTVVRGERSISLERQVRIAAGALIVLGVTLGHFVHPGFNLLAGFVGAGLVFAGVTDTCGMALLLARMPWNTRGTSCCETQSSPQY